MDAMNKSSERLTHVSTLQLILIGIRLVEEEISASHPGALDAMFQSFCDDVNDQGEKMGDMLVAFHEMYTFTVDEEGLHSEAYGGLCHRWDASKGTWVRVPQDMGHAPILV